MNSWWTGLRQCTPSVRGLRAAAVMGEIAVQIGQPCTADTIAETDAVVYRPLEALLGETVDKALELLAALQWSVALALVERLYRTNPSLGDER